MASLSDEDEFHDADDGGGAWPDSDGEADGWMEDVGLNRPQIVSRDIGPIHPSDLERYAHLTSAQQAMSARYGVGSSPAADTASEPRARAKPSANRRRRKGKGDGKGDGKGALSGKKEGAKPTQQRAGGLTEAADALMDEELE